MCEITILAEFCKLFQPEGNINYALMLYADEFKTYYIFFNRSANSLLHFALLKSWALE